MKLKLESVLAKSSTLFLWNTVVVHGNEKTCDLDLWLWNSI